MPIPIDPEFQGTKTTLGQLGAIIGTYLHIQPKVLLPDGQCETDHAPYTSSKSITKLLADTRKQHALQTKAFLRAEGRATNKKLSKAIRRSAAKHAAYLENIATYKLQKATRHIRVVGTISSKDVPWLLAYSKMLESENTTNIETESDE